MKFKIIFLIIFMILGCGNPSGPTVNPFESFTYPLEVGNIWTYETATYFSNFIPDTAELLFPDIQKGSISIEVTDFDSVQIGIELFILQSVTYDSLTQDLDSAVFLFNNEPDGLYEFANSGGNLAVPISQPPAIKNLLDYYTHKKQAPSHRSSILIDQPKQSLKFPIRIKSQWMFLDPESNLFGIDKKVISYRFLDTKIGKEFCFVVEWIYDFEKEISVLDYFSEKGLLKRTIIYKNVEITNYNNSAYGSVDIVQEFNIVSFVKATQ